ncbi:rod shape-determining protein MreD [Thermaurantiacus sp.]
MATGPGLVADPARARALPALSIALAILPMALPLPLAAGALPALPLLALIAWAGVQPRLVPAWLGAGLGLLLDLVAGHPLGLMAAVFMIVRLAAAVVDARIAGRTFGEEWLVAAGLLLLASLVQAALLLLAGREPALGPALTQAALSALLYPAVFALVARLNARWTQA